MSSVLTKRGDLDGETHAERIPGEEEGRDQGDAPTSQENQRLQILPLKL